MVMFLLLLKKDFGFGFFIIIIHTENVVVGRLNHPNHVIGFLDLVDFACVVRRDQVNRARRSRSDTRCAKAYGLFLDCAFGC